MTLAKSKAIVLETILPSKTMKRRLWPIALAVAYVLLIYFLGGLKSRHVMMASLALFDAYNAKTRKFLSYFFPFILTGIVYDSMRYYYWWGITGHIHIAEPYLLEKSFFGINEAGKILTPNEYFAIHTSKIFDFFCGFAYITFVAEYLSTAFILYFFDRLRLLRAFGWCFFLMNTMGFSTYYIYPAAPPWYITLYGFGPARLDVHGSAAAAVRFDELLGTHFFSTMYSESVDVYGAIPSLHVAYPLLVFWAAMVSRRMRIPALAFYFLMCFSAVYLQHHFVIDIILGTLYATSALLIVRSIQDRNHLAKVPWQQRLGRLLWPELCLSPSAGDAYASANRDRSKPSGPNG